MPSLFFYVVIIDKSAEGVSQRSLQRFLGQARRAVKLAGKVNVVLTSNREMRALNRRFRRKDQATDVLSFPAIEAVASQWSGDIAISTEIAAGNSEKFGHSILHEIKVLMLHGVLHLAGYDHESDNGQMARKEERLRRQLGLADGLIRRGADPAGRASKGAASAARPRSGALKSNTQPRRRKSKTAVSGRGRTL
jgi:probable rRNA maturation factor